MRGIFFIIVVGIWIGNCNADAQERRVVVVSMMKAAAQGADEHWHMWRYPGHRPTQKDAQGRHDIATVMYPLIGPYDVSDPHYQEYVIHSLRMIGVDTISLWWPGSGTRIDYTSADGEAQSLRDVRLAFAKRLMGTGLQACLRGGYDDEADLTDAMNLLGKATWMHEQRPVVMWFTAPKDTELSSARLMDWKASQKPMPWMAHVLLDVTDARYQPAPWTDATYGWVGRVRGEGAIFETGDFGTPPAHYSYLSRSEAAVTTNATLEDRALRSRSLAHQWSAVSPGFDDRAVGAWGQKTRDGKRSLTGIERSPGQMHRGTHTYAQRWEAVLRQSAVETVVIPTWDDWNEGSQIEPSVEDGVACLEVTRRCIAQFKGWPAPISGSVDLSLPAHLYRLRKAATKAKDEISVKQLQALSSRLLIASDAATYAAIAAEVSELLRHRYPAASIEATRYWSLP